MSIPHPTNMILPFHLNPPKGLKKTAHDPLPVLFACFVVLAAVHPHDSVRANAAMEDRSLSADVETKVSKLNGVYTKEKWQVNGYSASFPSSTPISRTD